MKQNLLSLGLLCLVAAGSYYFYKQYEKPCAQPITYRIGTFDTRFGVSQQTFLADAAEATKLWSDEAGRSLFQYSPTGTVVVNLVYDNRQKNAQLGTSLSVSKASLDAENAQIKSLEDSYNSALASYNAEVENANAHGGADPQEYATLQAESAQLHQQEATIQQQVADYNAKVAQTNQSIDNYNSTAGSDFEEGEYVSDASGKRIDLYEFTNHVQLVRLMAHEFGHALGLPHNSDPKSIMYPTNSATNLSLSPEDVVALKAECGL